MISFEGFQDIITRVHDFQQDHIFKYWEELNDRERKLLLEDIAEIDFELMDKLFKQTAEETSTEINIKAPQYIPLMTPEEKYADIIEAEYMGIEFIKLSRLAAFVVAGGQGTRLGFDGPKGCYPIGPVSGKSLFQIHTEKIIKSQQKYEARIPFLVMTSQINHDATVEFFQKNNFFGLDENQVFIFPQNMIPALDMNGKLVLETKYSIFKSPDGHGGSLSALNSSGVLEKIIEMGIETVSYFQVDNPLVNIVDPVFIGFHFMNTAEMSSKAVEKRFSGEKLGVFVKLKRNKLGIIEYSDLPENLQKEEDPDGRLKYRMGNIAIHLFNCDFLHGLTETAEKTLPFHIARKKLPAFTENGIKEVDGYKFEKFVFDALGFCTDGVILETNRIEEFAPVKNKSGIDSVESAQELMSNLCRYWLEAKNIPLPDTVRDLEISPLLAIEPTDLPDDLNIPTEERVYLK